MSEGDRLEHLARVFAPAAASSSDSKDGVRVGIGDDAAVLTCAAHETLVVSVDSQVEHVHFDRGWLSWEDVGYRATMAALSDLAAMGATPRAVFATLALPGDLSEAAFEAIVRGQRAACDEAGTRMLGGNLSRAAEVSVHSTVIGVVPADAPPLVRSGARAGDRVWLAGLVGRAGRACRALLHDAASVDRDAALAPALRAFRRPRALLREGRLARELGAHAMIDLSDGLAHDVRRIAKASAVAIVLDGPTVFSASGSPSATDDDRVLIVDGGEDFALVATAPAGVDLSNAGFAAIGVVEAGSGAWIVEERGRVELKATGYDHFP